MSLKIIVYESEPAIVNTFQPLASDHDVVFIEDLLSPANADDHKDAHIICIDQSVLTPEVLKAFDGLGLVAVRSTGFDHIDMACCNRLGITVSNVPGYAANAVAEHTFALLLAISRRLEAAIRCTRTARFSWAGLEGFELMGKTMAVIGTGAIGRRVAEIARGFNMPVLAYDLTRDDAWADAHGVRYVDFETAVSGANVISLNIPAISGKTHLLGEAQFEKMQPGVILINTARGELIDPQALVRALQSGRVSAAGLDVLPDEHYIREKDKDPGVLFKDTLDARTMLANELLFHHPNTVITPHVGWFTTEAAQRSLDVSVDNIRAFVSNAPQNVVVFPPRA